MRLLTVFIIITFFFKNLIASDLRIIRDAETENFLGDISKILIKKANLDLDGEKLNFYLDNKNYVNAFVTPGQNFFFTTKLLIDSKTVDELAGVIAHEIGHGVHQYLAGKNQTHFNASTPLTLAETASVFGEMLTFKSILISINLY